MSNGKWIQEVIYLLTVEVTDLGEAKGDTGNVGKGGKGRW